MFLAAIGVAVPCIAFWKDARSMIGRSSIGVADQAAAYAAYCMPQPQDARVPDGVAVDRRYPVSVPNQQPIDPLSTAPVHRITQGQKVEFSVLSGQQGALAVHGLSELVMIDRSRANLVRFKAIYSGRFPLHYHGPQGAHFELAVLEVLPA